MGIVAFANDAGGSAWFEQIWGGQPLLAWVGFLGLVGVLMALDLMVFHRARREISARESLGFALFYLLAGLAFGAVVYGLYATPTQPVSLDPALEPSRVGLGAERGFAAMKLYITGLLIELTLSLDNVLVISLIFRGLAIPRADQHPVLLWGLLGAIAMRGIMIIAGAALVHEFAIVLDLFALFLIWTGARMMKDHGEPTPLEDQPAYGLIRRLVPVTPERHGRRFLVRLVDSATGKRRVFATPLLLALVLVEGADLIFAIDSVPAIFAITADPYLVFTSNIMAILGLRAFYFALEVLVHRFRYLHHALAIVLILIGAKILLAHVVGEIPTTLTLGATVLILSGGVLFSLYKTRGDA